MPDLYLIDGAALAYRSYYAHIRDPLINSKGENTGAVFGFVSALLRLIKAKNVQYIGVTYDSPGPTFRHKTFEKYKANRKPTPDDLKSQIPRIHEVVRAMGIPLVMEQGMEADDIMATLATKASAEGFNTYLVTRDKDLMQLVNEHVFLFDIGDMRVVDHKAVEAKMGVPPQSIGDMLALMGDSSDNIPGIAGIGPKASLELLKEFGDLESVLKNAGSIKKKGMREKVLSGKEAARLSRELVELKRDVPLEFDPGDYQWQSPDPQQVGPLFSDLEFDSLLKGIEGSSREAIPEYQMETIIIDTKAKALQLAGEIRSAKHLALDTETTGVRPMVDRLVGISICVNAGIGYYLPLEHGAQTPTEAQEALAEIRPLLADPAIKKTGHNICFDWEILAKHGIDLRGVGFDTMVAGYVLDPSARSSLDHLGRQFLGRGKQSIKELIGTGKGQITFDRVPLEKAAPYAATDAEITFALEPVLANRMKEQGLEKLFYDLEMPLVPVLMEMEMQGIKIDGHFLNELSVKWQQQLDTLTGDIHALAGEEFNINSTQQLGKILFDKLGLKKGKKTKTGFSTNVDVLEELSGHHELPRKMLEYRQLQKLKSTYVDSLPALLNASTGRIHTSFNQTVTATGRLSSSNPNLQNIPIRTEQGMEIRKAFVPCDDQHLLLSADYSQIELRLLADFSQDEALCEAFRNGEDIHRSTAALVLGVFPEMVTAEQRRQAKAVNFGVVYGISAFGLARQINSTNREAQAFIDAYFAHYPRIREYLDRILSGAREKGYVETVTGRRRYLPDINSKNGQIRSFAERTAINMPIQGSAADLIKKSMISINHSLCQNELSARMLLQVHDELVFEVHQKDADSLAEMVRKEMEGAMKLSVSLTVDIKTGRNWLEAH